MMRILVGILSVALVGVGACSSDAGDDDDARPASRCANVTGNFNIKVTPLSGDCPKGNGADVQLTVARASEQNAAIEILPPSSATGCPAQLDTGTCRLTATCQVLDTATGDVVALINHDYTFDGDTFTGTVTGQLRPPLSDPACSATARHEGTRIK